MTFSNYENLLMLDFSLRIVLVIPETNCSLVFNHKESWNGPLQVEIFASIFQIIRLLILKFSDPAYRHFNTSYMPDCV